MARYDFFTHKINVVSIISYTNKVYN